MRPRLKWFGHGLRRDGEYIGQRCWVGTARPVAEHSKAKIYVCGEAELGAQFLGDWVEK